MALELKERRNETTGERMFEAVHSSGCRVYIMPRKDYAKSYALFATRYGSTDSEFTVPGESEPIKVPDGIAHYLEHKMFDMPDGSNIFAKFDRLGGKVNAFTSFDMTAYLFSATSAFYENLAILLDFVQKPYFTQESVEKERGIIGQEIGMYRDDPNWRVFFNFLGCLYKENPVKKDIAGSVESIAKITPEHLYKCYNTFYDLSNMTLFVTGDIDENRAAEVIENGLAKTEPPKEKIHRVFPKEPREVNIPRFEQALAVAKPIFMCGFKDNDAYVTGEELLKKYIELSVLTRMIAGKSSPLYRELYGDGLINARFSADVTVTPRYSYTAMDGESDDPDAVFERICRETERIGKKGLSKPDFERAKRVLWGEYIRSFNDVEEFARSFMTMHMYGADYFDFDKVYRKVTFEDVTRRFESHFRREAGALSVIVPM